MTNERQDPAKDAGTTSPGNEGSRGSRGVANRGAQDAEGTNEGRDAQLPDEGKEDLRKARAQGGGGLASDSTRSDEPPRR